MKKIFSLALLTATLFSSCVADRIVGRNQEYLTPSSEYAFIRQTRVELRKGEKKSCIWYTDLNDNGSYEKGEPYQWCG